MKKIKNSLAVLCAGAVLALTPSYAKALDNPVTVPDQITYEEKLEKIANCLGAMEKLGPLAGLTSGFVNTSYGLNSVNLRYMDEEDKALIVGIYEDAGVLGTMFSQPDVVLADDKANGFGGVDFVYKLEEGESEETYKQVELDEKEKQKFEIIYSKIINKFYDENEDKFLEFEKALEQDKEMKGLWDILESK